MRIIPNAQKKELINLCIASYGEDLGWLKELDCPRTVYSARKNPREGAIQLPNLAREASQYLYHILSNYNSGAGAGEGFPEWTVFLQGNPFDHIKKETLFEKINKIDFAPEKKFYHLGREIDFVLQHYHDDWAENFCAQWFGRVPNRIIWSWGAQFAVHRDAILANSFMYYRKLYSKIIKEKKTSAWAMERLWGMIFGEKYEI